MIDYWRNPVIHPSVCLWRCAFWLSGLVYRAKSCTSHSLIGLNGLIVRQ